MDPLPSRAGLNAPGSMKHFMIDNKLDEIARHGAAVQNWIYAYDVSISLIAAEPSFPHHATEAAFAPGNSCGYRAPEVLFI